MDDNEEKKVKGKIIRNKYEVIKILGKGSFGKVYLVQEIKTKQKFVIKKSIKENCISFDREINMLKALSDYKTNHNINQNNSYTINMIENFEENDFEKEEEEEEKEEKNKIKKFIVLEYKSRKSLLDYFHGIKKTISEKYLKVLFYKLAKGVEEIHKAGICHLDLKLENILLDETYKRIICDFGFACENSNELRARRGTLGYMAPEVLTQKTFNGFKADIFSLGAILLELATGKEIFKDKEGFNPIKNKKFRYYKDEFYKYIQENKINKYWEIIGLEPFKLSPEFKSLLGRMIHSSPQERPAIAEILIDPWFAEYNNLTEQEKNDLEEELKENQLKERVNIMTQENKKNEADYKNIAIKPTSNRSAGKDFKSYFKDNLELSSIEENNLDMKYNFKINGTLNPNDFMNELTDNLQNIKKEDEIRSLDIVSSDVYYKLYLIFDNEDKEIPEELKSLEFNDYDEYAKICGVQNLVIQIKLFKSDNGYLIRVIKEEGSAEDFNVYLKKIMNSIKSTI